MLAQEMKETVGLNQCHACGAEGLERDKFCRRCGVNHSFRTAPYIGGAGGTEPFECETRQLPVIESRCYSFSGALAQAVTRGVSERTSPFRNQRWALRLVSALVAVPLWLMIVLLSPFDAYVAAREIAKQV
ncbi:MAG: hypothetical protein ACRD9Y_25670 [Blastocatellia bacterium]